MRTHRTAVALVTLRRRGDDGAPRTPRGVDPRAAVEQGLVVTPIGTGPEFGPAAPIVREAGGYIPRRPTFRFPPRPKP